MVEAMALARAAHAASIYRSLPFLPEDVAMTLARHMTEPHLLAACAVLDGTVMGVILGSITKSFCGPALIARDTAFVCRPGGGYAAWRLIKHYVMWAQAKGAAMTMFGVSSGIDIDRAGALIERAGFPRIGALYALGEEA